MKLLPSNVGANPKQLAILGGLVVVLVVVFWMNQGPSAPAQATAVAPLVPIPAIPQRIPTAARVSSDPPLARRVAANGTGERNIQDFRPTLKLPEGTDVSRIDPSLRVEVLAKARELEAPAGNRSLFEFGAPPPPPPAKVEKVIPKNPEPVAPPPPPAAVEPPKPPPPPPITLKYYGYAGTSGTGQRRAFFLDGEDIFVAGENELVKNRYKIVRIGVNSAVVEDTSNKNQQTLPLIQELPG